jgi:hypothetical protein
VAFLSVWDRRVKRYSKEVRKRWIERRFAVEGREREERRSRASRGSRVKEIPRSIQSSSQIGFSVSGQYAMGTELHTKIKCN